MIKLTDTQKFETAKRVNELIKRKPHMFEMNSWANSTLLSFSELEEGYVFLNSLEDLIEPDCGTTMCLAGWGAAVNGCKLVKDERFNKWDPIAVDEHGNKRNIETVGFDVFPGEEDALAELFYENETVAKKAIQFMADGNWLTLEDLANMGSTRAEDRLEYMS